MTEIKKNPTAKDTETAGQPKNADKGQHASDKGQQSSDRGPIPVNKSDLDAQKRATSEGMAEHPVDKVDSKIKHRTSNPVNPDETETPDEDTKKIQELKNNALQDAQRRPVTPGDEFKGHDPVVKNLDY